MTEPVEVGSPKLLVRKVIWLCQLAERLAGEMQALEPAPGTYNYAGDMLADPSLRLMKNEVLGAHIRLTWTAWKTRPLVGSLDLDDYRLAAWSEAGDRWGDVRSALFAAGAWLEHEGRLWSIHLARCHLLQVARRLRRTWPAATKHFNETGLAKHQLLGDRARWIHDQLGRAAVPPDLVIGTGCRSGAVDAGQLSLFSDPSEEPATILAFPEADPGAVPEEAALAIAGSAGCHPGLGDDGCRPTTSAQGCRPLDGAMHNASCNAPALHRQSLSESGSMSISESLASKHAGAREGPCPKEFSEDVVRGFLELAGLRRDPLDQELELAKSWFELGWGLAEVMSVFRRRLEHTPVIYRMTFFNRAVEFDSPPPTPRIDPQLASAVVEVFGQKCMSNYVLLAYEWFDVAKRDEIVSRLPSIENKAEVHDLLEKAERMGFCKEN